MNEELDNVVAECLLLLLMADVVSADNASSWATKLTDHRNKSLAGGMSESDWERSAMAATVELINQISPKKCIMTPAEIQTFAAAEVDRMFSASRGFANREHWIRTVSQMVQISCLTVGPTVDEVKRIIGMATDAVIHLAQVKESARAVKSRI